MKKRCLIVAIGDGNRVIGDGKNLPDWNLRDDMKFFKDMTKNQVVIMGRKNYDSLPDKWRPLPERTNIIITKNPSLRTGPPKNDGVNIALSLWEALEKAERNAGEKIFIIGGGEIYKLALESIVFDEIHITTVFGNFEGTVFFPYFHFSLKTEYELANSQQFLKTEGRNSHSFVIESYIRKD